MGTKANVILGTGAAAAFAVTAIAIANAVSGGDGNVDVGFDGQEGFEPASFTVSGVSVDERDAQILAEVAGELADNFPGETGAQLEARAASLLDATKEAGMDILLHEDSTYTSPIDGGHVDQAQEWLDNGRQGMPDFVADEETRMAAENIQWVQDSLAHTNERIDYFENQYSWQSELNLPAGERVTEQEAAAILERLYAQRAALESQLASSPEL